MCVCVSFVAGSFVVERAMRRKRERDKERSRYSEEQQSPWKFTRMRVTATCLWLVGEKLAWFGPPSHLSIYTAARLSHPRLRAKGRQGFGSVVGWRRRHRRVGKRDEETGGGGGGSHSLEGRGGGWQRGTAGERVDGRRAGERGGATVYASRVG